MSTASGIPTFRGAGGTWKGHDVTEVATPEAWFRNRSLVREFYDERRVACAPLLPNPGHEALARLQQRWGAERVTLITQNIDGITQKAGAVDVLEMHGSLWLLRCESDATHHPRAVFGRQDPSAVCRQCSNALRPAVVWFGEMPQHLDRIGGALQACQTFISVGTSGVVYPAADFVNTARAAGATTIEINPQPSGGDFDHVIKEPAETALPRLIGEWLGESH